MKILKMQLQDCPECLGKELVNEKSGATEFCSLCQGDGRVTESEYEAWMSGQNYFAKQQRRAYKDNPRLDA